MLTRFNFVLIWFSSSNSSSGYKLRRQDGNPFYNEMLGGLEGHRIHCAGELEGNEIVMDRWEIEA